MPGLVDAGEHLMLNGLAGGVTFVSLHTADPNPSGGSEVSGGSYARKAASWAAAASGSVASNAQIIFDVPAATTITHLGYWSASTSGTFYGSRQLDTSQTYSTAGTYTIPSGSIVETLT